MSGDESGRVCDLFRNSSRDVTPVSRGQTVRVLYTPVSRDPDVTNVCASVLPVKERQRAERFACRSDRALFLQRRAFRRFCGARALRSSQPLSRVVFEKTEQGRPFLPDLPGAWFSFSSCSSGMLAAWSETHGIGVDIEDESNHLETVKLARHFFTEAEADVIERQSGLRRVHDFHLFWCLKEAALKSIGQGLPFGLDAFEFELDPDLRVVHSPPGHGGPQNYAVHEIPGPGQYAALVIRDSL